MVEMIPITPQPLTGKPGQLGNLIGTNRWFAESVAHARNPRTARPMLFVWTAPSVDVEPEKIDGTWYWVEKKRRE